MPVTISPDDIRALGFDWPGLPRLEQAAVAADGQVDLETTLSRVEADLRFFQGQIDAARRFSETWNAPMDDVTDRLDKYHDGVAVNDAAAARLRAILTAIAARDRQRAMRST